MNTDQTDTMTEAWERVAEHLATARLIAWDTCHKMYLAMDDTEADWFRENYEQVVTGTPEEMLATLRAWWDESCFLRFISAVSHDPVDPNAGFVDLIAQFADCDDDEDEDEEDDEDDEEDED